MPGSHSLLGSTSKEGSSVLFVHSVSEAGRLVASASRWNSIEVDFGLKPKLNSFDAGIPSSFYKSVEFKLTVTNRRRLKHFITVSLVILLLFVGIVLMLNLLPNKGTHHGPSMNFTLAVNQALKFFDAQKSGILPTNNSVKFRGNSGLRDGNSGRIHVNLVGGFYDSGNNVKFGFPTAYTITLLSWSVIEYHEKYVAIGELDHVRSIIKWGCDYLLKVFVPSNSATDPGTLYSQVGSTRSETPDDIKCWQSPEDMTYERPVSICKGSASDLAGETMAALSAASLVFRNEKLYSQQLAQAAERLFEFATMDKEEGIYTMVKECGGEARDFYNSSGYHDELVWGGTWLFFATGNRTYLQFATQNFTMAVDAELDQDKGVFYWNNKLPATMVLLSRIRYFHDLGYPYEATLKSSSNMSDMLMCSYLYLQWNFNMTPGGLIMLKPSNIAPLQYAATASFLSKLYSDYLNSMKSLGRTCSGTHFFSLEMLRSFSKSQVEYILGNNPLKLSYLVGFGETFPTHVHHRGASTPEDGQHYSCEAGKRWLYSKDPNPNLLLGAMVAGPDGEDVFSDKRDAPEFTQPTISANAALVAALIALHDPPPLSSISAGLDVSGIFKNIPSE